MRTQGSILSVPFTLCVIILTAAGLVLTTMFPDLALYLGLRSQGHLSSQPHTLFTYPLIHTGFVWWAIPAAGIALTGGFLEPRLGRLRFSALILTAPLVSGSAFLLLSRTPEMLVGTGGMLWALLGASATLGLRGWSTLSPRQRAAVALSAVASLLALLSLLSTPNFSRNGPIAVATLFGLLIGAMVAIGPAAGKMRQPYQLMRDSLGGHVPPHHTEHRSHARDAHRCWDISAAGRPHAGPSVRAAPRLASESGGSSTSAAS